DNRNSISGVAESTEKQAEILVFTVFHPLPEDGARLSFFRVKFTKVNPIEGSSAFSELTCFAFLVRCWDVSGLDDLASYGEFAFQARSRGSAVQPQLSS
ncbi:MAG: hypothetical protein AAF921_03005, partial [Cyanobacteria bacterium P01_D01_bin.44]